VAAGSIESPPDTEKNPRTKNGFEDRVQETSTDSTFELHKEKEMPEFRKWIIASAAVTLFAGLASAQVGGFPGGGTASGTAFTCGATNGSVTPTLRAEGYTELTGDIVIICSGGSALSLGTLIPTANITVFLNTTVTSRLLSSTTTASEAMLLIDEPNSTLAGYGPSVPQTACANSAVGAGPGGCAEYVGTVGSFSGVPVAGSGGTTVGANVFQGVTSGNQVVFNGIPVMPPATSGDTRVYRITNVRANANLVVAGGTTLGSVTASLSFNSSTSIIVSNSLLTVGYIQPGLSQSGTSFGKPNGGNSSGFTLQQCVGASLTSGVSSQLGLLQFTENFDTAFKVRGTNVQNIPGAIFSAESGFTFSGLTNTNSGTGTPESAGLADYGTRLKAVFSNIPSGVTLYVTTRDIVNEQSTGFQNGYSVPQAWLVLSETAADSGYIPSNSLMNGTTSAPPSGIPSASQTTVAPVSGLGLSPVAVNPTTNTGGAVWEVVNTNPNAIDTIDFGLYITYTANAANNLPTAPATFTVTLSYAPTASGTGLNPGAFSAATGALASSSLTLPRFNDALDVTKTVASVAQCTTAILFPYVINVNGFDTGLAIANTSTDPFGTAVQNGTCSLYFYGTAAPATGPFVTPVVASGTVYANLASTLAPGFDGYMIANCNFQFAHGFAFVSDVGARNLAMGYLALIFPSTTRNTTPESLNN